MPRPYTDITKAISSNLIKNGTVIVSSTFTGQYGLNNNYVINTPTIEEISSKYGNRFYNGIFVQLISNQTIVGG